MTLWAIVPVKPLQLGKSRLAKILTDEQRLILNRRLLLHTLRALGEIQEIDHILVISRDPAVLSIARQHSAYPVQETGRLNLNHALAQATAIADENGCDRIMIMPADIPLLTRNEVKQLILKLVDPPVVVISPDRRREGTNALLVSPPRLVQYTFGYHSFGKHCENARQAGARLEILELPNLAVDIDLPEDFDLVYDRLQDLPEL